MKHYKDSENNLFGLEDNVTPPSNYVEITIEEAREIAAFKIPPPSREDIQRLRESAYRMESDPLFFKAQRGEATHQEWLDSIAAIQARYPY